MEKTKSIRVGEACWRLLRQWALDDGVTVRGLVERLALERPATHPHGQARVTSPEARCVCGVPWKDHQAGTSGRLAVRTNCRTFRETE
jgi:hypothetical protein